MPRTSGELVRDEIPACIEADGEGPVTDVVEGDAYRQRLFEKLDEEMAELHDESSVEELAAVREAKREKRGAFEDGVVLERVESR